MQSLHVFAPRRAPGDRPDAASRVGAPSGSIELIGLLLFDGRSEHSVRDSFHGHVRRQAHRKAHDRGPRPNIAPYSSLSPSRPDSTRGMAMISYTDFKGMIMISYIDIIGEIRQRPHCRCSRRDAAARGPANQGPQ